MILHGLKIRLNKAKCLWVKQLYPILWAYRTTLRIPTGESPFNLAYETETMISLEIGLPSTRVEQYNESNNSECQRANLDLLPELRHEAQLRMATYRQKIARYYNTKVKPKIFWAGDLVLRKVKILKPLDQGKLSLNWEGLYKISAQIGCLSATLRSGTYQLETLGGSAILRIWNADNLKLYYQ